MITQNNHDKVALITGGARRVGAVIARYFHQSGYHVLVHYRHSREDAYNLVAAFNQLRPHSAACLYTDLDDALHYETLIQHAYDTFHRLDVLVNNASTFFKTPIGKITEKDWDLLFNSNLKAPLFLSQAAAPHLRETQGNIINIVDIHAKTPMKNYPVYSCAKAGLHMLTQSLAMELAPKIRVNAIAPGSVIWPENNDAFSNQEKKKILAETFLQKQVSPDDIAKTAIFLAQQESITGQMICVDAGRS